MTKSSAIGAAIEGEKIDVKTRQPFHVRIPRKHPVTSKTLYCFTAGIRSSAEIAQSYTAPKHSVTYSTSMTDVGDVIEGQVVSGWALKPIGPASVKKGSGAHSASFLQMKGGCYARVDTPPREHLDSPLIQTRNPPIQEVLKGG